MVLSICTIGCTASEKQLEGKPWVNPELPDNLPAERPGVEENYYLNVNYDLQQKANSAADTKENPDAIADRNMMEDIWEIVNTGESAEARSLRILTSLITDKERRTAEGRKPLMDHVERIQATKTLEELSKLCREENLLVGMPYASVQLECSTYEPAQYVVILYLQQVIPEIQPDEDAPEQNAQPQLDTKRVEEELTLLGYDAERAKQLTERITEYDERCQTMITDNNDYNGEGAGSSADIRAGCTPLYDQLVSLGMINSGNESQAVFQTIDYSGFRAMQKQCTEENLDLFQAIVCLSLSRYALDYLDPAAYAQAHGIEGEADLKEAAFEYIRIPAMFLTAQTYAAEKARMMKVILVTPEEHTDYEPLLKALSKDNINLLQAAIQQRVMELKVFRNSAGRPYDRERWTSRSLTMVTTNAIYEPGMNAVYVMIGILQPKFYQSGKSTTSDRMDQTRMNCLNLFDAEYNV